MLFSNDAVAAFINNNFESAWESVRPVPIVRIDFGNGTALTRTLHGNIATYVCTADGKVFDILPGIYTPAVYTQRLADLKDLAVATESQQGLGLRDERIANYHERMAAPAQTPQPAKSAKTKGFPSKTQTAVAGQFGQLGLQGGVGFGGAAAGGLGKFGIEMPVKVVLAPPSSVNSQHASTTAVADAGDLPKLSAGEDLANWKALAIDTRVNETVRRKQIHELLAKSGPVSPADVTKDVYKVVLHVDLDDPYLGLGEVLFASYPFAKEDAHR